ncbi:MAG: ImmA/IrrE family metallo-endopeptidase, partial [Bacteroidales bacterium]|nr:ImmA/IrrE family metallo-endopeptidase [Bacteroidales bacterium]
IENPPYNQNKVKDSIHNIKTIMAEHTLDFFERLQEICKDVGVKIVYTPCLPKAPIHGSTRWHGDTPLIQLSARYKTNDKFWFTFFHEVGHILLHGKKFISLENVEYEEQDLIKEQEADDFAVQCTFSEDEEKEVLDSIPLKRNDIISFAKKFNTHPALIIGRFHHKKIIHYSIGREFIESIDLEKTHGNE